MVLTDVPGLYADWPNSTEVIHQIDADALAALLPTLASGMIPKMEACLEAVRAGVPRATVIDGRVAHSLLLEIFTDEGIGTMVLGSGAQFMSVVATGGSQAELTARYGQALMNTFGPPKRVFVRGEGVHLWDADGNRYLDLLAGLAVNALGHAHPQVLGAVSAQLSTLGHVSNFFATPHPDRARRAAGGLRHSQRAGAGRPGVPSPTRGPRPTRPGSRSPG